jgi:hypothetical protein
VCFVSYFFAFCVFVLFRVSLLPVYTVVYFVFVFKFTDHYRQVETKLQLINIISHHIIMSCQSHFAVQQVVFQSYGRLSSVDCSVGNTLLRKMGKYLSSITEESNIHHHKGQKLTSPVLNDEFCRLHLNIDAAVN